MNKKIAIIVLLVLLVLAGAYFGGAYYYKDKFQSNVYVNEIDIGGMTLKEAEKELGKADVWDRITIKSDTEEFLEIKAEEIDYKYVGTPGLDEIFNKQNQWEWPLSLFEKSEYTKPISSDYNRDIVKNMVDGIEQMDKVLLDASVAYSEDSNAFVVVPHSYEIKLNRDEMFDLVTEHIDKRDNEVNIEKNIEQPALFDDDESLAQARDKANQYLAIELKYDFADREEIVNSSQLKNWITFNGSEVDIDPEKVREYVVELATTYDTFGRNRQFKTASGNTITTNGGAYGWMTHRGKTVDDLIAHIKAGESKTIEPVYSYTAQSRSSNDIGNSYVEIDLYQQMVYVYIDGEMRVKTPTVTGNTSKGYSTPAGVDALTYKQQDAVLRGEDYASPVKYWMPFNGNIGLHDADWRGSFGGDIYKTNGSHGCINLPPGNAKAIFDLVYQGMPVIVH